MRDGEGRVEDFRGATNSVTNTESKRFWGVLFFFSKQKSETCS